MEMVNSYLFKFGLDNNNDLVKGMKYTRLVPLLLLAMIVGFASAADQPYTLREVFADDISVAESPEVTLDCVDIDGDAMAGAAEDEPVDINFYKRDGTLVSQENTVCSTAPGSPYITPLVFNDAGLYYVTAELQCAPACCDVVKGCDNRHWFSVTRPFTVLNVPDANWIAALAACAFVLFIARKK